MRPVNKWATDTNGVTADYNPYQNAKSKLLANFGNEPFYFCSYCDRCIPQVNLAVEHIQPKDLNPLLKYKWSNFLIACTNCNLAKDELNIPPGNLVLPHLQNTWNCFLLNNDGTMEADPNNALGFTRSQRTVQMLGLDRGHNHPDRQATDDRYNVRLHVMLLAKRALKHYEDGVVNYLDDIIFQATVNGFWYVWMKVFERHAVVQNRLIAHFNNTYQDCMVRNVNKG